MCWYTYVIPSISKTYDIVLKTMSSRDDGGKDIIKRSFRRVSQNWNSQEESKNYYEERREGNKWVSRLKEPIKCPERKRKINPHTGISLGHFTILGIKKGLIRRLYMLLELKEIVHTKIRCHSGFRIFNSNTRSFKALEQCLQNS